MKNTLARINNIIDATGGKISFIEDIAIETIQAERKKTEKSGESIREPWNNFKQSNTYITRFLKSSVGKEGKIFEEIMP